MKTKNKYTEGDFVNYIGNNKTILASNPYQIACIRDGLYFISSLKPKTLEAYVNFPVQADDLEETTVSVEYPLSGQFTDSSYAKSIEKFENKLQDTLILALYKGILTGQLEKLARWAKKHKYYNAEFSEDFISYDEFVDHIDRLIKKIEKVSTSEE